MRLTGLPIDSFRDIDAFLMPRDRLNLGRICREIRSHIATFMSQRSEILYIGDYGDVIAQTYIDKSGKQRGFIVSEHKRIEQKFLKKVEYCQHDNLYNDIYFYGNTKIISNDGDIHSIDEHDIIDITNVTDAEQSDITLVPHVYIDHDSGLLAFYISDDIIHYIQNVSYARSDGNVLEYKYNSKECEIPFRHYTHAINLYDIDCGDYRINFDTGDLAILDDHDDVSVLRVTRKLEHIFG
jgi:hypothetical protein